MRALLFIILLSFFCTIAFGQTEPKMPILKDSIKYSTQISSEFMEGPILSPAELFELGNATLSIPQETPPFQFNLADKQGNFDFKQAKTINELPNIGISRQYNNTFIYNPGQRLSVSANLGLVQQNTVLSASKINYQFTIGASAEYAITDWLFAYLYGQYVTPSLTQDNNFVDPLLYWDNNFVQTNFGTGLRTKFRSVMLDVGMTKTIDTPFQKFNNVQTMDSKLTIGF